MLQGHEVSADGVQNGQSGWDAHSACRVGIQGGLSQWPCLDCRRIHVAGCRIWPETSRSVLNRWDPGAEITYNMQCMGYLGRDSTYMLWVCVTGYGCLFGFRTGAVPVCVRHTDLCVTGSQCGVNLLCVQCVNSVLWTLP